MKTLSVLAAAILLTWGCSKEKFTSDPSASLYASSDSLRFDTVFTSTGSVSQFVKIINENDKGIHISSVKLAGGPASPFKINVDGFPGPHVQDLEVAAGDSMYIYVTVTVDPSSSVLPFIISDSIEIAYNGNRLWVQLEAFGQNAHFMQNVVISGNETWNNDLPYVILDALTISPGASLTINKGSRIYVHADAPILVHGSLQVHGGKETGERVVFSGDRLDEPYRDFPAGYPGIILTETSSNNVFRYALIKNAYQGIVVAGASSGTKLRIEETIIDNAYDVGLLALNTSIYARNLLVSNSGKNLVLVQGGTYVFEHCTFASFSTDFIPHRDPVATIANYIVENNQVVSAPLDASFTNCIFWGESGGLVKNEVRTERQGTTSFNLSFNNVLWKMEADPQHGVVTGENIRNTDPSFESTGAQDNIFNFRLRPGSPAIDKGSTTTVTLDLDGNPRPVTLPDLGAYEHQ